MELAALVLLGTYGVVAFGVRTWLQVRRTADTGFRGLSGRPGSAQWWAGVLLVAALGAVVAGPVAGLAGLPALLLVNGGWVAVLGGALAALGIAGTLASQLAMGDSWRIGVDQGEHTELVTRGPFARVRNPIFAAMVVTALGIALLVPNALTLLGCALLVVAVQLQVRVVEEPYLRRHHGPGYQQYAARVGRFVPGVGRLRPGRGP